ncbi:hypothetical protein N7497_005288 [Penicillium chrysogenum]|nr:hypothetical protein N7497_005288 [Penicillium chrysogenum]
MDMTPDSPTRGRDDDISSEGRTRTNSLEPGSEGKDPLPGKQINSDERVADLARTLSEKKSCHELPFELRKGSALDPQTLLSRVAGLAFNNLNVVGYGSPVDYQMSVGNAALKLPTLAQQWFGGKKRRINILQDVDGLLLPGEQLCVLGPPGSGCSTLLKTIAGETHGFEIDPASYMNYQGITPKQMSKNFRGEVIYTAEVDAHYPQLAVGDTLYFAALARTPREIPGE